MSTGRYNQNTGYNYGSTAPDIYREVYVPPVRDKRVNSRSRQQGKLEKGQAFKRKFFFAVNILIIFMASGVFVWGCAVVSSKQYDLAQAKAQVRDLKSQVNTKKAIIASSTNFDHIKLRAMKELNMAEPLPHQIVYIDIKKTSYTMVDKELKDNNKGW